MGISLFKSKSSSSQTTNVYNKTPTDYSTSDVGQNLAGQASAGKLSNVIDSTVFQTVSNTGLAGSDLVALVDSTVKPIESIVKSNNDQLGQAFSTFSSGLAAATSSTAGITSVASNAINAVKSAAVPIAIVLAIWGVAKIKGG